LIAAYAAEKEGEKLDLPLASSDGFLAAERAAARDERAAAFWRSRASGSGPLFLGRRGTVTNPESWVVRDLAPWLVRLRAAGRDVGVGVKAVALALHATALMTMCNRDVVTTGVVVSGRLEGEGDEVAGLFLNTLPFTFSRAADWRSLAVLADSAEREAYEYRHFPLALIERAIGHSAFDVLFNYTQFSDGWPSLPASDWWSWDKAGYPFTAEFMIESRDFGTSVGARYDRDVVGDSSVEAYMDGLFTLLDGLPTRS
jgi:Condensation domain